MLSIPLPGLLSSSEGFVVFLSVGFAGLDQFLWAPQIYPPALVDVYAMALKTFSLTLLQKTLQYFDDVVIF